jgi:hypothetical protein
MFTGTGGEPMPLVLSLMVPLGAMLRYHDLIFDLPSFRAGIRRLSLARGMVVGFLWDAQEGKPATWNQGAQQLAAPFGAERAEGPGGTFPRRASPGGNNPGLR